MASYNFNAYQVFRKDQYNNRIPICVATTKELAKHIVIQFSLKEPYLFLQEKMEIKGVVFSTQQEFDNFNLDSKQIERLTNVI